MSKKSKQPKNLFSRLTRLFRSGPVVKRKIRALDTTLAVADKTKSSGALLFQKSLSPTYATITSNAYNLSERLMRYQDFQEMEYCVSFQTLVPTTNGMVQIGELAERCKNDPNHTFIVYSYDHEKKKIVPAFGKQARYTRDDHAWKVTFDSGKEIIASAEHRLMMRDGTYREVRDLKPGDSMMPFYRKDLFEGAKEGTKGYSWVYTMDERFRGWTKEHQLIAEWIAGRELEEDEVVHHINFDKKDNRPENLRIMKKSDHDSYHAALNNCVKWAPENREWVEEFKKNHAQWMRDNAPTARRDVTFGRILEVSEMVDFDLITVSRFLDVDKNVIYSRLADKGFSNYGTFVQAYRQGNIKTECTRGLFARDLSLDLIIDNLEEEDTKQELCIKLGCTVNVLNKFFDRKLKITWSQLREKLGWKNESTRIGGRPRSSNGNNLTFQQICDAYTPGITLPRLSEKLNVNKNTIISRLAQNGYKKYSDFQEGHSNHKVVSVEYVGVIPLYDLTVDGYKNFATDSIISHNTPEIAAALDIYADETVGTDEKGQCLHIYSDNEKIKELLEDLFYNTLNVEFNLRSWARNLVKYGDFFLYNDVHPEYGVINAFPIPVNEIEREENYDKDDPFAVRYRWVSLGNRTLENWEVTHFRLLGNDMFLPYGSSIIEPARRIWRQLILIEDAMLVYRVVRAPERRVFYIDVANMPAHDIPAYIEEQRARLRTSQVADQQTGRVDLRYNPMPVHKDTPVPLLDGRTLTIEQLSAELAAGKQPWVYSVQDGTGRIVPGKVTWCDRNYVASRLTKVWLDDGTYVLTAPEHPFVMRDGSKKKADELSPGDSLMPLYRRDTSKGYEECYDPSTQSYVPTHQFVARDVYSDEWKKTECRTVHHKAPREPNNKKNNDPSNLQVMSLWEHRAWHVKHVQHTLLRPDVIAANKDRLVCWNKSDAKKRRVSELNKQLNSVAAMAWYNGSEQHTRDNAKRSTAMHEMWSDPVRRQRAQQNMRYVMTDDMFSRLVDIVKANPKFGRAKIHIELMKDDVFVSELKKQSLRCGLKKYSHAAWENELKRRGYAGLPGLRDSLVGFKNHKVDKVEIIDVAGEDVYCMTVTGPRGEDDRHNFAVLGLKDDGNRSSSGIFVTNSVEEDYLIPVRGGDSGTKIDTLAGGQNTAAVEDVAYIQKKLFAALKIPRAYLGYDEMLSSKATLAQEDIRFSRTINVIQKTMISELNKLAIVHLYAHGYDNEDLQNFTLRLSNPSTVAQQQKLELWRAKFEIAGSAPDGFASKRFIRKEICGLNDEQIERIDEERMRERLIDAAIEVAGSPDEGGGDLFGSGGAEMGDDGGAPPEADEPPKENAGEEPEEEIEPKQQLLTGGDDPDDDESFAIKLLGDLDKPVNVKTHLDKVLYNRSRRRTHGASKTHMPDFRKMTSNDNRAMEDPYDSDWIKSIVSNPFGESHDRPVRSPGRLPPDVRSMLSRMSRSRHDNDDGLIVEGKDVQDSIDSLNEDNEFVDMNYLSDEFMNEENDLLNSTDRIEE